MLKLIVFDWDDVFTTGSTVGYHACYIKAAKKAGAKVSEVEIIKTVNDLWGRPHELVIQTFMEEERGLFDEVNRNYEKILHTETFLNKLTLIPGSAEMLERLSKKYQLAVVSGINPTLLKERVFLKFSIPAVFSRIVTSYDLKDHARGKPNPDMLNLVLNELDIDPNEAIHVGDAPGDVYMAKAAGVEPVVVLTGQLTEEEACNLGVEHIIEKVTDLETLLPKFN